MFRFVLCCGLLLSLAAPVPALQAAAGKTGNNRPAHTQASFLEAAATWADVQVQLRDLAELIRAGRLDEVHPVAFEIRDLVRTLPERSKALPAASLRRLEAQVRVLDRLAEQLDRYADAGKAADTARQEQAVRRTLAAIEALYPRGALRVHVPAAPATSRERELYLTPGGAYTAEDIRANGNQLPSQRFRGVRVNHDLKPAVGDRICPITLTRANPGFRWTIAGKEYLFCCPPCVEEYVTLAKTNPGALKPPDEFIKKAE
jgi:YHS domain-containing protein